MRHLLFLFYHHRARPAIPALSEHEAVKARGQVPYGYLQNVQSALPYDLGPPDDPSQLVEERQR